MILYSWFLLYHSLCLRIFKICCAGYWKMYMYNVFTLICCYKSGTYLLLHTSLARELLCIIYSTVAELLELISGAVTTGTTYLLFIIGLDDLHRAPVSFRERSRNKQEKGFPVHNFFYLTELYLNEFIHELVVIVTYMFISLFTIFSNTIHVSCG